MSRNFWPYLGTMEILPLFAGPHYYLHVQRLGVADVPDVDIIDIYGHTVQKGSEYIMGHYLVKVSKKTDKVYYKELAKPVYVYPAEIAVPINQEQL